ncbi:MAG: FG-GAP repeat protein [Planctomycetota bacterium JB042]
MRIWSATVVCLVLGAGARAAEEAYLKPPSVSGPGGRFGVAVAVSGDTAVVGELGEDGVAQNSGAAHVFVRSGGAWAHQATLKASNAGFDDQFGTAVSISGDTIVVGAPRERSAGHPLDDTAVHAGAAYVFVRSGTTWSEQAYLKASNAEGGDRFGNAVAISGDTIVVGAWTERSNATGVNGNALDNSFGYAGAAYVFARSGSNWTEQAYLKASNTGTNDHFGWSVAVDGDLAVVGAVKESSASAGVDGNQADDSLFAAGAAYVFERSGTTWAQAAYLKASNAGFDDQFGWSVAVSGETVVVGAPMERSQAIEVDGEQDDDTGGDRGAAYVFERSGGSWGQTAYLKPTTQSNNLFGQSVAVDGGTVLVGAITDSTDASWSGAAYVFVDAPSGWAGQAYLWPVAGDADDQFGTSVALSGDTAVVGAPNEDSAATGVGGDQTDDSLSFAGAAWVHSVGQPWIGLGHAKGGVCWVPLLTVDATLTPGSAGSLTLLDVCGFAPAALFVGLSAGYVSGLGGTLVPSPLAAQLYLTVPASGTVHLPFVGPPVVPPGTKVYVQFGIHDAAVVTGTPDGVAFSNAVELTAQP